MRIAILAALVACSPGIPEGVLLCGASDPCPPGFFCRSTGTCFRTPDGVPVDGSIPVDAGPPVACENDPQCEDGDPCTLNDCKSGFCETMPVREGESCGDGAARCCGGRCIQANTGAACGAACEVCETNEICRDGNRCECADGFGDCDTGAPGCETNLDTDAMHCGECPNACTTGMSCIDGMCRTCMIATDCDDGQRCTADDCVMGACVRTPLPGDPCDDGNACTGPDACTAAGLCDGGAPRTCVDDGNACTSDVCNPADGLCSRVPTGAMFCNDGEACTSNDRCMGTLCQGDTYGCHDVPDFPYNCSQPLCNGTGTCDEHPLPNGTMCQDRGARHVCQDGRCVDLDSVCCSPGTMSGACCASFPDATDFAACRDAGRCTSECCTT